MAEAAVVKIVGIHLQSVKKRQKHLLLGKAHSGLIVADGAAGYPQLSRQLLPGDVQFLPPPAQLLAKAHGKCPPFDRILVFLT